MKNIFLIRGCPGAGKSTLADALNVQFRIAADDYFMVNGEYKWDASKLRDAHKWCLESVDRAMQSGFVQSIAVHNTFTTEKEMEGYISTAEIYGFRVTTLVVEHRHTNTSIHNVPSETIKKMIDRFDIKLY